MPPVPTRRRVRARPPAGARNPRANAAERREVLDVVRGLADRLDPEGRSAVVLVGSWARGDAHEGSDVDLWVIGSREGEVVLKRGGRHVSLHYATVAGNVAECAPRPTSEEWCRAGEVR